MYSCSLQLCDVRTNNVVLGTDQLTLMLEEDLALLKQLVHKDAVPPMGLEGAKALVGKLARIEPRKIPGSTFYPSPPH